MPSLRILNAEPDNYSPDARAILDSLGQVDLGPLTRAQLLERVGDYDVLIVRLAHQIDAEVLERAGRLKAVVSATTGLDHIDLEAAQARGVAVLSLRGEVGFLRSIPATAEHTWGLLLALTRRIPGAFQSVLAGRWERDSFRGHDLAGKTLGILGLGRVGVKVARYGLAFDMRVAAYDPHPLDQVEGVYLAGSIQELFTQSQVLSVHVPLKPETVHLVGQRELGLLPPGALLVNTSRGDVLDERALLAALEGGRLAGAALDVISGERASTGGVSPLVEYARAHDNLLITPHIAGATCELMAATEVFVARKLARFLG